MQLFRMTRRMKSLLVLSALAAFAFTGPVLAQTSAVQRPIGDFLSTQGTFCIDDGMGGCFLFVPPIPNFFGWSALAQNRCGSVDYAGLANATLVRLGGRSLGTRTQGTVLERPLADGRAEVTVTLHTTNALSWVMQGCEDFASNPLLFGHRLPEVLAGKDAALGDSLFEVVLINTAPGAPLPDMLQLFIAPLPGQEPRFMSFYARAVGTYRALAGVPDGTPGRAEITQTGLFMTSFMGAVADAFPAERIGLPGVGKSTPVRLP